MVGLQAQVLDLPPAAGVSEDTGKYVPTQGLHEGNNYVWARTGELVKRSGYTDMETGVIDGSTLPAADRVLTCGGELLEVGTSIELDSPGPTLYTYSPGASPAWVPRGAVSGVSVARRRILGRPANDAIDIAPQVVRTPQFEGCLLLTDGTVLLRITDLNTGAVRDMELLLVNRPKVILLETGGDFRIVFTQGALVVDQTIDPASLTVSPLATIATLADVPLYWDAVATTGVSWAFASVRAAGDAVDVLAFTGGGVVASASIGTSDATRCSLAYRGGVLLVAWDAIVRGASGPTAAGLFARTYVAATLTGGVAPWLARSASTYDSVIYALGAGIYPDGRLMVASTTRMVDIASFTSGPVFCSWFDAFTSLGAPLGATSPRLWHVLLGSRPFALGTQLFCAVHGEPGASLPRLFGYALVNLSRYRSTWHDRDRPMLIEACVAPDDGKGFDRFNIGKHLTLPPSSGDGVVLPIVAFRGGDALSTFAPAGADAIDLSVNPQAESLGTSVEAAGLLLQGGAWPSVYDGLGCVEAAFFQAPEINDATAITGPGPEGSASGSGKKYAYIAIYQWRDAAGRLHRSRPSNPVTVALNVAGPSSVRLSIRTTCLSRRGDPALGERRDVQIAIYRSLADAAGTHYDLRSYTDPTTLVLNRPDVPTVQFVDTKSDADVRAVPRAQLYTDGGALAHDAPPPLRHLRAGGGRLWGVSAEKNEVWFTKSLIDGEAPAWSVALRVTLDEISGRVVASFGQDGAGGILTDTAAYLLGGDGPNDTGLPAFLPPARLQAGRGCLDARTLVEWRGGAAWVASEGIVMLSRKLELVQLGRPVERTIGVPLANHFPFFSAQHDPARDRIVWTYSTDGGRPNAVVYDCALNAWTTWSLLGEVYSQALWRGHHVLAMGGQGICIEGSATDSAGAWVTSTLTSPWLRIGALGAHLRLWRIYLQLEQTSPHGLQLDLYVDGDETSPAQTETWTSDELDALPTWPRAPLTIGVGPQKSTVFKFRLRDSAPVDLLGGSAPAGFTYHGAALQLGAKKGLWKGPRENQR